MGFLRTIAIIVLVYYGLKYLMRFLAPFLIQHMAKKMTNQFQNQQTQEPKKSEGEVTVKGTQSKKPKFSDKDGEYVDYEEIKD